MNDIISKMRNELRLVLKDSVDDYPRKARDQWLFDWPSQLILVVNQIYWCQEVEQAFTDMGKGNKDAMIKNNDLQVKQLTKLIEVTRTELPKDQRQKVMNMITIDAHSRDMVQVRERYINKIVWPRFHAFSCRCHPCRPAPAHILPLPRCVQQIAETPEANKADCFQWVCQLRSYWDLAVNDCRVRICDASFPYGYEYLGNGARLVITPLTDRIYITATQACWLSLGTAPAGPAGTGKTETTKDLSAQLGKSIYVFNCAPEMVSRFSELGLFPAKYTSAGSNSLTSLTHLFRITEPWEIFSRALLPPVPGAALTSSTASFPKCCPCARSNTSVSPTPRSARPCFLGVASLTLTRLARRS